MKKVSLIFCVCLCWLCACTPMRRGFDGNKLVSPSRPEVTLAVPSLPVLAEGQANPFLYTDHGFQFPETFVGVYGSKADAPMAITVLSFTPGPLWEWDRSDFSTPAGTETTGATFGEQGFEGKIRLVNGASDPFTPLIAAPGQEASINWIAQRFVLRAYFNQSKIILEYREPATASMVESKTVSLYDPNVQAFIARASKAFTVTFGVPAALPQEAPYLKTINGRFLGNFLGTMTLTEPMWRDARD